jgi:predicted permease
MTARGSVPRLYRLVMRLYPHSFRERLGESMGETFAEELGAARARGVLAIAGLWLRTLMRAPFLALEERARARADAGRQRRLEAGRPGAAVAIESLLHDLRSGVRVLGRSPVFVVITVLTVALGVGATASLFSIVNALLLRPLPVQEPDRLVRVHEQRSRILSSGIEGPRIPFERYRMLEEATRGAFSGMAAQNYRFMSVRAEGPAFPAGAVIASGNYFEVLGVRPALGRFFFDDDEPVVVLGYRLWQQRFGGSADVVGRTVYVNGYALTVAGVAARDFGGTIGFLFADLWVPHGAHGSAGWQDTRVSLFGRLRPDIDMTSATTLASAAAQRIPPDDDPAAEVQGVRLEPMSGTPAGMAGPVRGFLGLMLATAFLVLLIAGANVAGMLLARAVSRRREMAVRLALGIGRVRLMRQLMVEAVLLFLLGGVAGMLIAVWVTRFLSRLQFPVAEPILIDATPDVRVFAFALTIAVVTGVFFGTIPAWHASRSDLAPTLSEGGRGASRRGGRMRDVFVAAQLAMSVLLLIAATLFVRTLQRSLTMDPGFVAEGVVMASLNLSPHDYDTERGRAFFTQLVDRVNALNGVESAALADVAMLTGENETFGAWRSEPGGEPVRAGQNVVDGAYFETMRIRPSAGRGIAHTDVAGAPRVIVVNETFARRFWPDGNAVGRIVLRGEEPHEVVGVVPDGAYVEFGEARTPFTFLSTAQRYSPRQVLHVRARQGASTAELIRAIRDEVAALDADVAVQQAMPLSSAIGFLLFPQRFAAILVGVFGILGLVLAGIGVYGVLAHNVAQRTREFGIRIALGADTRRLLAIVLRRGALLAIAGTTIGLAAAAILTRFMASLLHGVSPLDAPAFIAVPLVLGAVALLASYLPARRTLGLDPVEALRRE